MMPLWTSSALRSPSDGRGGSVRQLHRRPSCPPSIFTPATIGSVHFRWLRPYRGERGVCSPHDRIRQLPSLLCDSPITEPFAETESTIARCAGLIIFSLKALRVGCLSIVELQLTWTLRQQQWRGIHCEDPRSLWGFVGSPQKGIAQENVLQLCSFIVRGKLCTRIHPRTNKVHENTLWNNEPQYNTSETQSLSENTNSWSHLLLHCPSLK